MELQTYVRSFIRGRVRIRHEALAGIGQEEIKFIESVVLAVEGVQKVSVNPTVGSALLVWDPEVLSIEQLKEHLACWLAMLGCNEMQAHTAENNDQSQSCATEVLNLVQSVACLLLDEAAKVLAPGVKNVKRARRLTQNRIMLGFASASVASLAFNKGSHGVFGWGFAAFALLHLWQHRRVL